VPAARGGARSEPSERRIGRGFALGDLAGMEGFAIVQSTDRTNDRTRGRPA
jgi:hypothetical protein